ncbi:response regulator [Leptolyngbya sp. AN03gr2]|uniref:response regulator n=1 Tax=unclassified Leptolyngbya TaxID=2650499 RepID=UPI003D31A04A
MNWEGSLNKPIVLAVDDNLDNLVLLEFQLAAVTDCAVVTATTGEAALHLAEYSQPDLILLDIQLPDISGVEVAQRLRQSPTTNRIPIVALTALARNEDRDRILNSGCNDYLTKPYELDDLQAVVTHHLSLPCSPL